ncbi:PLP-dependent cysteine synthase family protein [Chloroflexota bacterium]
MYFKNVTSAIGHTPLVELVNTSPNKRVRILAKLEGQNLGGSASIKDRIAKYMLDSAEQSGELTRDKTIIEATSGNTGIALAWLGHNRGYRVTIVMPDSMSQERQQLLKLHHAKLVLTRGALGIQGAIDATQEIAARDKSYFQPDQFSNPANPLAHYETTAVEILNDFPYERIDALVAGIGTGGTVTGVSRRLQERFPGIRIIGVEPPADDSIQGLKYVSGDYVPPILDLSLLTEKPTVTNRQAVIATRHLLEKESIFAGLSSGAAVHQALKLAGDMDSSNIVVILPDGGWKYLSMDFWLNHH